MVIVYSKKYINYINQKVIHIFNISYYKYNMDINIDKKYYLYNRILKILINIILYYIFLLILFSFEMSQNTQILSIVVFSTVLLYILDGNFPAYTIGA
jgi:hypothetical protein